MKRIITCILIISALLLCSCARTYASPEQVLSALLDAEIGLPAGQIYLSTAPEDSAQYLPPDLAAALYGEGELPWQLSLVEDYGLFLCTAQHPCEFAVFRTYARSNTDDLAAMCHARLDALRVHYKNTQYAAYLEKARVVVMGKYVLLIISSDPEHAMRAVARIV